jgi:hypothetical protein
MTLSVAIDWEPGVRARCLAVQTVGDADPSRVFGAWMDAQARLQADNARV